ncbi:mitotic checkpoint regulator, MAD2B-interacting-domain-containing protein [Chaetomium tenue]|uniref:Mitotic checkpoint regulator, MAD2B-interacting-domain-containing protein n=1 Tax=Chaetomium tenue TaxID=1854479 RepID=A0ACB7PE40_9PEZI|nr:mitotic checkpoint regulator, MAD2B-interacting-domain-containing protein [Chaetomium globosum]
MGLVDYSDSESDTETVPQPKPNPAAAATKKPFQKLLDRSSGPGKIVVNLSTAGAAPDASAENEQPPAKRVKTAGTSRFSGLGSFLPPPKRAAATTSTGPAALGRKSGTAPAPGVHLRTGAEPAFARGGGEDGSTDVDGDLAPGSKSRAGPTIPEGQKPEEEVKLVGKPLMFKPLSVARKKAPAKSKKKDPIPQGASAFSGAAAPQNQPSTTAPPTESSTAPPPKKKVSLFSMDDDETTPTANPTTFATTGTYQPLFPSASESTLPDEESDVTSAYPTYQPQEPATQQQQQQQHQHQHQTLTSLTDGLSRAARRELFGRSDSSNAPSLPANAKVISFDMEREYAHNEALRTSGAAQPAYNPVRSIAPGKHSLRQVVNMAQSNQEALEESFARAKSSQKDAAGRMAALLSALPEYGVGDDVLSVGCVFSPPTNPAQLHLEQIEFPKYILAKSLFDCREFQRCAAVFLPRQDVTVYGKISQKYGLVLAKDRNEDLAITWLLRSVSLNPWNWGAWQELSSLVRSTQHLNSVQSHLKPGIMAFIFSLHCRLELRQANPTLVSEIAQLQNIFPRSLFLESMRALAFYQMKDLYEANLLFSKVLSLDPRYLDFFDSYSNVLYSLGAHDRLAFLAQLASSGDRYRPETSLVIGNYYSLSSQPEAAIAAFRRALSLDRTYSAAWALLGHEYLKAQNLHAAVESYRQAINHARHDYRALFGLGKAYEALKKPALSLHYYLRATAIRPGDADLLQAAATGLAGMSRFEEAIKLLKRALAACSVSKDGDGLAARQTKVELLFQLGNLYEEAQNRHEATAYLEMCLVEALEGEETCEPAKTSECPDIAVIPKAQLLLARWALEDEDYSRARYFTDQIERQSELGKQAQDLLNRCSPRGTRWMGCGN